MRTTPWISVVAVTVALVVAALGPRTHSSGHHPGNGVTLPVVVSEVKAYDTPEEKAAGIHGTIGLDTVVLADGNVRRYTRLSNGFSRKLENHEAAVALNYFA